jgi:hypothetical protein
VKDQRELVEHQPGTHPEHHREQRGAETVPGAGHRAEAADHGQDDTGHDVVDVQTARLDVAERTLARADEADDDTGDHKGQHEGGECQQKRQLSRFDDVPLQPMTHIAHFIRGAHARPPHPSSAGPPPPRVPCAGVQDPSPPRPPLRLRHPDRAAGHGHPLGP